MPSKKRPLTGEEIARNTLKQALRDAARNVQRMVDGKDGADERRFADVTVQQKASLILAGKALDAERAKQEAGGPKVLAPIFLVPQIKNDADFERMYAHVEATGELPPMAEKLEETVVDVEEVDASQGED